MMKTYGDLLSGDVLKFELYYSEKELKRGHNKSEYILWTIVSINPVPDGLESLEFFIMKQRTQSGLSNLGYSKFVRGSSGFHYADEIWRDGEVIRKPFV